MTTLIAVYRGKEIIGRCDARCYDARSTTCKCVCHGANHGAGYARALHLTQENGERWLIRYLEERHLTRDQVTVTGRGLGQLEMKLEDSGLPSMRLAEAGRDGAEVFWTVHLDPIDRPGAAVACRWRLEQGQLRPDGKRLEAGSLEGLRALRPSGVTVAGPARDDPATITEVWLPGAA